MKNSYRIEGDKCFIELTQGKEATIDVEDMELVGQYRWFAVKDGNTYYAYTHIKITTLKMHRLLIDVEQKEIIDHIDSNGLNNCKNNLRIVTQQQNLMKSKAHKDSTSEFKGVSWFKRDKKWRSMIYYKNKHIFIGLFASEIEAARAYDKKAKELFGEFAYLNFKGENDDQKKGKT